ncbi:chromosomal replication initiator protein DnaA [Candidatus Dependentiae bacterium]|nr:chromosomal replication initiator protein DnaA [Candidatus Dependentiae bacterium]
MVENIWDQFLTIIRQEAGSRVVETWFKAVSLTQWDVLTSTVYLQAPNRFVRDWIKQNYTDLVRLHLGRLLNVEKITLIFIEPGGVSKVDNEPRQRSDETMVVPARKVLVKSSLIKNHGHINRSYSFESFVVGPNNSLAYAAAQAVTQKPGAIYNPLFLYGGSGLGKTHLLHAIGNNIKAQHKKISVLYQTADRFVNEFINAIRFDELRKFQLKYKSVDVLLVDDIQFISNKEQTQEAFFHIFNALHDAHKQIVFSSDTFPQNLAGIADRLKSRMAWGLVADVCAPTIETKIAILQRKADMSNESLSDEVAYFIANSFDSNIRELEGALIRVIAFASLTQQPVTLELAKKVLIRSHETSQKPVSLQTVIKCVGKHYPYTLAQLRSKSRNKQLSFARQVAMFLLKETTDTSLRDIGVYLGGRDHSTVVHAVNKVEKRARLHDEFQVQLKQMEREILRSTVQ